MADLQRNAGKLTGRSRRRKAADWADSKDESADLRRRLPTAPPAHAGGYAPR